MTPAETPDQSPAIDPLVLLALAELAAREAGALLREKLGTPRDIQFKKSPSDLVTDGDKASEALITAKIRANFPDHRILAEEGTTGAEVSPYRWLIDPVDGTTNFAHGVPAFAVAIGVEYDGVLQAGVVYNPVTDELFAAARGRGATLNGASIAVSSVDRPEAALSGCGTSAHRHHGRRVFAFPAFVRLTQGARTTGAGALDICYVACGRFELFCGPRLAPWDVAAATMVVLEAGGKVTDFDGRPHTFERKDIMVSNGLLHRFGLSVARGEQTGRPGIRASFRKMRSGLKRTGREPGDASPGQQRGPRR